MELSKKDLYCIQSRHDKMVKDTFIEMIDYARCIQGNGDNAGVNFLQDMVQGGHMSLSIYLDVLPAVKNWDQPYKVIRN